MKSLSIFILMASLLAFGCSSGPGKTTLKDYSSSYRVGEGEPVEVVMTVYSTNLLANGTDITRIRVVLADRLGNEISNINRPVDIIINGDARILHPDLGKKLFFNERYDSILIWQSSIENGVCEVFLQSGSIPGLVRLEARCDELIPASQVIHTLDPGFRLMKPTQEQLDRESRYSGPMMGADISELYGSAGTGTVIDGGVEKDGVSLLADHGFNYARLRIPVGPEADPGSGITRGISDAIPVAKKVKDAGLKLILEILYSDNPTAPGSQEKPVSWEGLGFEELAAAMKSYSSLVITELAGAGIRPDIVQVGNSIDHGMLWPEGYIGNPDLLAELIRSGVDGIREADPAIPVMLSLASGGQNQAALFWLNNMIARGVEFDLLGLSFIRGTNGTLDDLNTNLHDLAREFGKPVCVAEYSNHINEVNEIVFALPDNQGAGAILSIKKASPGENGDEEASPAETIRQFDMLAGKYLR